MPARINETFTLTYTSAKALPPFVMDALKSQERESNIMYPHAEKARLREDAGEAPIPGQLWIACLTAASSDSSPHVDLVLSCTENPLGTYPIFIFANVPFSRLDNAFLSPRIELLVQTLHEAVSPRRVYSIFAPDPVARAFASSWSRYSGISLDNNPEYYAAKFTYCTARSFVNRSMSIHPEFEYVLRKGQEFDIPAAAELCHGFAEESAPFTLTMDRAVQEATVLIRNSQLWVHEVKRQGKPSELASIVAVTRQSAGVSAITKVYTNPRWRKRGCAERLVRQVCKHLLLTLRKESVVLFVAHNNPAAAKVYHRVGFQGLSGSKLRVEGVDPWVELGFDRKVVQLGHW